ncbi:MAG: hypothetical protein MZW92_28965 [Comamonadaceae bacterium]|nr:hypothetical protein [Comamonadaceae bacterium]
MLLVAFDAGLVQISHNQLYGKWRVMPARTLPGFETEHRRSIRVVIATAERAAVLLAATTLELVDARDVASHPLVARLGPDVLDRATTVALVRERYLSRPSRGARSRRCCSTSAFSPAPATTCAARSCTSPAFSPASRLDRLDADRLDRLARATLAVPRQSLATGGVTNDRALARELAARGVPFEERRFHVYGREGERCRTCGARIRRQDAGRAIFFCPRCQRRWTRCPRRLSPPSSALSHREAFGLFDARDFRLTDGRDAGARGERRGAVVLRARGDRRAARRTARRGLLRAGRGPSRTSRPGHRARDASAPRPTTRRWCGSRRHRSSRVRASAPTGKACRRAAPTTAFRVVPRIPLGRSVLRRLVARVLRRSRRARARHPRRRRLRRPDAVACRTGGSDPMRHPTGHCRRARLPARALRAHARGAATAAPMPFHAETLWQRPGGASRDWTGRSVLAFVVDGAQGDDDEAHGGHFAIATGRIRADGAIGDWLVNNFYSLDIESEKGILAAPVPLDNYLGDLNSGQALVPPSVRRGRGAATTRAPRSSCSRRCDASYQQFWRHQLVYHHPTDNCTSISVDALRAAGPAGARARTDLGRGRLPALPVRRDRAALARRPGATGTTMRWPTAPASRPRSPPRTCSWPSSTAPAAARRRRAASRSGCDATSPRSALLHRLPQAALEPRARRRAGGEPRRVRRAGAKRPCPAANRCPYRRGLFPESLRDDDLLPQVPLPSAIAGQRLWRALVAGAIAVAAILARRLSEARGASFEARDGLARCPRRAALAAARLRQRHRDRRRRAIGRRTGAERAAVSP